MRKIHLMNEEKRDATVALESVKEKTGPTSGVPGKKLAFRRYLASTEAGTYAKLSAKSGDLAQALIDGDPEIDIEVVGNDLVMRHSIAAPTIKIARMTVAGS